MIEDLRIPAPSSLYENFYFGLKNKKRAQEVGKKESIENDIMCDVRRFVVILD